ncbi:MAG: HNH endonuclease [Oligoflexia bacterium]|nr:HNH endonuclease [Bdellovibrionales bacterium]MYE07471.1 HNH endonuclease [Oligoflexia bacterium]
MKELFLPTDKAYIKKERQKAKELKKTLWWKNKLNKKECYYCEKKFDIKNLSMDHLVPLVRGGRSTKNNVVVACKKCNSEKKYKTLVEIRLNK